MWNTIKAAPSISSRLVVNSQQLSEAITTFKSFLNTFIKPYVQTDDDVKQYKLMLTYLDSNQTLLSLWIARQLKPHESDNFTSLVDSLSKTFKLQQTKIKQADLKEIKNIFIKILMKLTACV